ncbi:MAG: ATP-dependent RNA helicase [Bogoriella megaspora]|nr:MAG: ATP-dependent RNA helicase [Bogoriella megaspora]
MAPDRGKRKLPPKILAMKARKRQKLEGNEPNTKTLKPPNRDPKQNIKIEDLNWSSVELPDRMDDYEGFFGLEEVEGVDIVKNTNDGRLSYRMTAPSMSVKNPPQEEHQISSSTSSNSDDLQEEAEGWGGFSDENDSITDPSEPVQKATAVTPVNKQKNRNAVKARDPRLEDLSFKGLQSIEDDSVNVSGWDDLKLGEETLSSLSRLKFSRPTPIQSAAIPEIRAGHDVIGKAVTGSGKTLAFGIPILESFMKQHKNREAPIALILSPTRELAHQLTDHISSLGSSGFTVEPSIATVTGGLSLQKQQRLLARADIVVGTPGRLWEVMSDFRGLIDRLKKIDFLVVDEADRLLSQGHFKEVEEILNALDRKDEEGEPGKSQSKPMQNSRQTLVFSATFQRDLQQKLAGKSKPNGDLMSKKESMEYLLQKLNFREPKPKFIDVNPVSQMAEGLNEGIIECAGTEKDLYLYAILLHHPNARTLIFANSISAVRRLTPFLQNLNLSVLGLHSHMPQKARLRSIERFTAQKGSILVATDVAARGLDIPNVQLVIHYHLPRAADMYVHRSGRTARATNSGSSIIICSPEEVAGVRRLLVKVHVKANNGKRGYNMQSLDLDRRVVAQLKPRTTLAKQLADTVIAKEKKNNDDEFFRAAAEELGVEYDSEEMEAAEKGRRGRGSGRKKKEREARSLTKAEIQGLRAELKGLLAQRVNVGVSERYLTSGGLDVDKLLKEEKQGNFLGPLEGIGLNGV